MTRRLVSTMYVELTAAAPSLPAIKDPAVRVAVVRNLVLLRRVLGRVTTEIREVTSGLDDPMERSAAVGALMDEGSIDVEVIPFDTRQLVWNRNWPGATAALAVFSPPGRAQ